MDSSFACVVEFGSREGASCSAIILDAQQGYVVSHASLLLPYIYCKPTGNALHIVNCCLMQSQYLHIV